MTGKKIFGRPGYFYAALFALASITSIAVAGAVTPPGLFDPAWRAIIPADRAEQMLSSKSSGCSPALGTIAKRTVSDTWNVPEATVDALELKLVFALKKAIEDTEWIGPQSQVLLSDYEIIRNHARQYAGVTLNGRKLVLIVSMPIRVYDLNGPTQQLQPGWALQSFLGNCDGGPRQFSALYDPETEKFSDFFFTGTIAGYSVP